MSPAGANESTKLRDRPLEVSMIELSNQMRQLTIQARIISNDQLSSPLLDERIPGERFGDFWSRVGLEPLQSAGASR